ncbi:heterokaryon incompatibility protein [Colletotrichum chrysophilum]|uniref:Heterokaryon incompatibility protein n=1 Tax=Colletotrichum chrysophilum TaxID=1836956 RepID=A0AAD9ESC3_9PEZI|nr:heterokaryon incompatibility protein [Colletotrichum chrysophilum]
MVAWHDPRCRKLDFSDSGGLLSCLSCGSVQLCNNVNGKNSAAAEYGSIYQPLKNRTDMRLLTLEPGEFNDTIRCSLSQSTTSSMTEYDAISYTWGGEDNVMERRGRILLDGRDFPVTPNCEAALKRIRSRGAKRIIWIDAVCMNQEDIRERGHQVRLMPLIYSRAQNVLIYVGEPSPNEEMLLLSLTYDYDPLEETRPLQEGMSSLFQRRYFARVWILQEVALARKAMLICVVVNYRKPAFRNSSELLKVLDSARHSFASDPRDKVFAVFGLITCAESDGFSADYSKSTKEVFMHIAAWIAERFGIAAMIARTTNVMRLADRTTGDYMPSRERDGVPVWVPDWTDTPLPVQHPVLEDILQDSRALPGMLRMPVAVSVTASTIKFPAFCLGTFQSVAAYSSVRRKSFTSYLLFKNQGGVTRCTSHSTYFTRSSKDEWTNSDRSFLPFKNFLVYLVPNPDSCGGLPPDFLDLCQPPAMDDEYDNLPFAPPTAGMEVISHKKYASGHLRVKNSQLPWNNDDLTTIWGRGEDLCFSQYALISPPMHGSPRTRTISGILSTHDLLREGYEMRGQISVFNLG